MTTLSIPPRVPRSPWVWQTIAGTWVNLASYGIIVESHEDTGVAPLENILTEYALLPGGTFQRVKVRARLLTLRCRLVAESRVALHQMRATLVRDLLPNLDDPQPIILRYDRGDGTIVQISARYADGLRLGAMTGQGAELLPLKFLSEDPFWEATNSTSVALDPQDTISNANQIVRRNATGTWTGMNGTSNSGVAIYDMIFNSAGTLYVGGSIGSISGVTVNGIASWNGTSWAALGTGVGTIAVDSVHALAVGADGTLYAGGSFSTMGGTAAANIAKWNGSTWSALGSGTNNLVSALAFGPDGLLYAGGSFTTAGGGAANNIATWNGSAWSAFGGGMGGAVYALEFGRDGSLYAGGAFTTAGGVTVNRIARWNGSAWVSLAGGVSSGTQINALSVDSGGIIYAGGNFTAIGGISAANIAKWNGSAWSALGSGLGAAATDVLALSDGSLIASGIFTTAGGASLPDSAALWTGAQWRPLAVNLPGTATVLALAQGSDGLLYLGYDTDSSAGGATAAGSTTVTVTGSADVAPVIAISGNGTIYQIVNETTGIGLFFTNLTLLSGETITINCAARTVTSTARPNMLTYLTNGSGLAGFTLRRGANSISALHTNGGATVTLTYTPAYWSLDG